MVPSLARDGRDDRCSERGGSHTMDAQIANPTHVHDYLPQDLGNDPVSVWRVAPRRTSRGYVA